MFHGNLQESEFLKYIRTVSDKSVYFEPMAGNNGDALILKGAKHVLAKAGCKIVDHPESAQQIFINGGGAMNDVWRAGIDRLIHYRQEYPDLPVFVGPSTYRFQNVNLREICEISKSPLILFARDNISADVVRKADLPLHCDVRVSPDLAFELHDSDLITELLDTRCEKHVLIAMRKDREGSVGILAKTKGTWLPKKIRRPLSWLRDRLVALSSRDVIEDIIKQESIPNELSRIYRDVSVSMSFEDFVTSIRDAAFIITDRLHVGILGHMLNKRVVLRGSNYHKIKGVYELSMSGEGSRTKLCQ